MNKKRFWNRFKSEPAKPTKNIRKVDRWVDAITRYIRWLLNDKD